MHDIMDRVTNISWRMTSGATLGGFEYEYDAAGRVVSRAHTLGDPSQMSQSSQKSYAYDDLDRLASEDDVTYTYDAAGRRIIASKTGTAFTQDDSVAYNYNIRSELTNAVASVDSDYRYAYDFDDIGNRESSSERGTNSVYAANQLNQYCSITTLTSDVGLQTSSFSPQFDDDGNQTLVKTSNVMY